MELAGSHGAELILLRIMRDALTGRVSRLHQKDHSPFSNAGAGLLLLEKAA